MSKDTLSELLRAVRLRGAIFFSIDGISPWVAEAPKASEVAHTIFPGVGHMIEYHVVLRGTCWGAVAGGESVQLNAGDVIMFPQGDAHVMSSAPGMRGSAPAHNTFYLPKPPQLPFVLTVQGDQVCPAPLITVQQQSEATVMCGFLGLDARPFNPLLTALPRLLHMPGVAEESGWIELFTRVAARETSEKRPGGEAVLERLSEMMFIDVLRRYIESIPTEQTGWFAGLRDRFVGRALALMHERPSYHWNIDELGDAVGLSRSALHDRFVQFVGMAPMQYLAQWRMQVASQLLLQSTRNVAAVALESGYESEAAFSRAFKRVTGMPPAAWRRQHMPEPTVGTAD